MREIRLERLLAAIALAQDGVEVHFRQHEQMHLVSAALCAAAIGLAQRLAKRVGHRMPDDDHDFGHARSRRRWDGT